MASRLWLLVPVALILNNPGRRPDPPTMPAERAVPRVVDPSCRLLPAQKWRPDWFRRDLRVEEDGDDRPVCFEGTGQGGGQ